MHATSTVVPHSAPSAPETVLFGLVAGSSFGPPISLPAVKANTSLIATAVSSSSTSGR